MEIERKFLIAPLPNLANLTPVHYERYFIEYDGVRHVRVQNRGGIFEIETKIKINDLEYKKTKEKITEGEFLMLSRGVDTAIIWDSYLINKAPNITIKKYFGAYEELIRAEIEYENIEQAEKYPLPEWFWNEITGTELGNYSELIKLSKNDFLKILKKYSKTTFP